MAMEKYINYYELIVLVILTIGILFFWIGKYLQNRYYINKSKKEIDKAEKLFGARVKGYVNSWRRYLAKQERENQL